MLNKQQKKDLVKDLSQQLKAAKSVVFSSFSGLPTRESQELRRALRQEGIVHKVVKITLLQRALRLARIAVSGLTINLPVAVSLSLDDEVAPARILQKFASGKDSVKIVAGVLDGQLIDAGKVKMLANLPGKTELRGQLVGVIASPLRGLASVLTGNIRELITVLNAKSKLI